MVENFSELSGYEASKKLMAQRYNLGGKSVFTVSLPLHLVGAHLPIPNPEEPFDGNRRVNVTHARKFGEYWRNSERCVTPPLLFDTTWPLSGDFDPKFEAGGVEFGTLSLPHNSSTVLEILDGQHRILGWHMIAQTMTREYKDAAERLSTAKSAGEEESAKLWQDKMKVVKTELARLENEYVTLQVVEGLTLAEHKQVFADIANNAKGITKSVTVGFDQRSILNQTTMDTIDSVRLLQGHTDLEVDRVSGSNDNILSARNVSDIVKHALVGIDGRMTKQRESVWKPSAIQDVVDQFFYVLTNSFPQLQEVAEDELHPADLREKSLLASPTVLRCLAGAFHDVAVEEDLGSSPHVVPKNRKKVELLFQKLAPTMGLPISDEWFDTGFFPDKTSRAPSSRAQDLKGLTSLIASWAS